MKHGEDDDLRPSALEENAIGEASKKGATHCGIDELIGFGMASNGCDRRANSRDKLASETGTLGVVPRVCAIKIKLRLRGETKSL